MNRVWVFSGFGLFVLVAVLLTWFTVISVEFVDEKVSTNGGTSQIEWIRLERGQQVNELERQLRLALPDGEGWSINVDSKLSGWESPRSSGFGGAFEFVSGQLGLLGVDCDFDTEARSVQLSSSGGQKMISKGAVPNGT